MDGDNPIHRGAGQVSWRPLLAAGVVAGCAGDESPTLVEVAAQAPAEYVGGELCAACHVAEAELWRGSHHDLAMAVAGPAIRERRLR